MPMTPVASWIGAAHEPITDGSELGTGSGFSGADANAVEKSVADQCTDYRFRECAVPFTVLIYAGASGNDQDLVAVLPLAAVAFGAQQDGNPIQLNPGWRVAAVFAGAGNNLVGTAVAYYRVMVYAQGWETDTV